MTSYLEGLYWILTYYHKGCQSWNWFYPYLYAPLASDLINLASINVTFSKGKPFTPLLQLLSVLPPQSGNSFFNCYLFYYYYDYYYYYYYYYIMYILLHIHILYTHKYNIHTYIHTYTIILYYTHTYTILYIHYTMHTYILYTHIHIHTIHTILTYLLTHRLLPTPLL